MKKKKIYFKKVIVAEFEKKLIYNKNNEEKVIDHCHVTGKFRGAAHREYNVNLKLTRKVPVIFNNLRSYDIHLIFNKLDKFDVKIKVIPNGLQKDMAIF